jgi:hypothetical protein
MAPQQHIHTTLIVGFMFRLPVESERLLENRLIVAVSPAIAVVPMEE